MMVNSSISLFLYFILNSLAMNLLRIYLLVFIAFISQICHSQQKRALMVGISNYDLETTGWDAIHGAEDIELLSPELERQGFQVTALINEEATHDNIVATMELFSRETQQGDIVYIHFSCHGQPFEDGLNGNELDELDGWDEALIPIDAMSKYNAGGYTGDKHIIDDSLNVYFTQLREKVGSKGMVYVALDACHSGTMSRNGLTPSTVRGTIQGFTASGKRFRKSFNPTRHYSVTKSDNLAPILFLEACRASEQNMELTIDGKEYGSVTYNVLQSIKQRPLGVDGRQFVDDFINSTQQPGHWNSTQHPVIESSFE